MILVFPISTLNRNGDAGRKRQMMGEIEEFVSGKLSLRYQWDVHVESPKDSEK